MSTADDLSRRLAAVMAKTPGHLERLAEITARVNEPDQDARQSALYEVVRAELDASLGFISGCKVLPRRQRRPRVGPWVRDYLASQIARKVIAAIDSEPGATVVPSDYFDELRASPDEPAVPNEATKKAFRRLNQVVTRRESAD